MRHILLRLTRSLLLPYHRSAAAIAGLIPTYDCQDFVLVYEPEAAALTACAQNNISVEVSGRGVLAGIVPESGCPV